MGEVPLCGHFCMAGHLRGSGAALQILRGHIGCFFEGGVEESMKVCFAMLAVVRVNDAPTKESL